MSSRLSAPYVSARGRRDRIIRLRSRWKCVLDRRLTRFADIFGQARMPGRGARKTICVLLTRPKLWESNAIVRAILACSRSSDENVDSIVAFSQKLLRPGIRFMSRQRARSAHFSRGDSVARSPTLIAGILAVNRQRIPCRSAPGRRLAQEVRLGRRLAQVDY